MKKLTCITAFLALFACSVSAQKYWVDGTTSDYYGNPLNKSFALIFIPSRHLADEH